MPTLHWIGKEAVVRHHREVPFRLLEPVPELACGAADSGPTDSPLLGVHEDRAIYLLDNGRLKDRSIAGGKVLTDLVFDVLPKFAAPKVIYAAASRIGGRAARAGIRYKQTPHALEV